MMVEKTNHTRVMSHPHVSAVIDHATQVVNQWVVDLVACLFRNIRRQIKTTGNRSVYEWYTYLTLGSNSNNVCGAVSDENYFLDGTNCYF